MTEKQHVPLPIKGVISRDAQQQSWKHGIGCVCVHDTKTGEPRLIVGNTWYPDGADQPVFMRGAASLGESELTVLIDLLQNALQELKKA